jgi:hypothetical protein
VSLEERARRRISAFIDAEPIVDVHEHHLPGVFDAREVGLLDLLRQSYAGWTQARPYPLPSESRREDPMLADAGPGEWEDVRRFVEDSGSSAFVRNLLWSISELYAPRPGGDDGVLDEGNWRAFDAAIRARHRDPEWPGELVRRAGVESVITDAYTDPLLDARAALGESYRAVFRINALAFGWHPARRDHNGQSAHELARRLGVALGSFDDYLDLLELVVESLGLRNQVALKNALAYDRDVCFDEPDEALARSAWGVLRPGAEAEKAFGDFVVDRLCRLAGERDVPMQVHLGTALVRGSHPLGIAGLVERHPGTRFLLMHLAYPWSRDLLGMAFVYRNIWLDLTWSFLLSPSHAQLALHEAIEILPDESRLMLGGDNWHAEETYGTIALARRLLATVLGEKLAQGYFSIGDAERLARKVLHENARRFFRLDETA